MIIKPEFLTSEIPLSEYPRPQFKRDSYFNLNGVWNYAITKTKEKPSQTRVWGGFVAFAN